MSPTIALLTWSWKSQLDDDIGAPDLQTWPLCEHASNLAKARELICSSSPLSTPTPVSLPIKSGKVSADEGFPGEQLIWSTGGWYLRSGRTVPWAVSGHFHNGGS